MRALFLTVLALTWLTSVAVSAAPNVVHIGRFDSRSEQTEIAVAVLTKAYSMIGVKPYFDPYPLRRSLMLVDQGTLDGEVMRAEVAIADYPNLIRVKVPIAQFKIAVYARGKCPATLAWSDLRGRRVAYPRGVKLFEIRLAEANAVLGTTYEDIFRTLQQGGADFALTLGYDADLVLRELGLPDICRVPLPLEMVPAFHVLNQKHRVMAIRLEKALAEMERSGELATIWRTEHVRTVHPAVRPKSITGAAPLPDNQQGRAK